MYDMPLDNPLKWLCDDISVFRNILYLIKGFLIILKYTLKYIQFRWWNWLFLSIKLLHLMQINWLAWLWHIVSWTDSIVLGEWIYKKAKDAVIVEIINNNMIFTHIKLTRHSHMASWLVSMGFCIWGKNDKKSYETSRLPFWMSFSWLSFSVRLNSQVIYIAVVFSQPQKILINYTKSSCVDESETNNWSLCWYCVWKLSPLSVSQKKLCGIIFLLTIHKI